MRASVTTHQNVHCHNNLAECVPSFYNSTESVHINYNSQECMCTRFNLHMVLILIFHGYNPLLLLIVFLLVGTVWKWAALSTFQTIMLPHELCFLQTLNSTSHVYENRFSSVLKLSRCVKYVKYTDVIFVFSKSVFFFFTFNHELKKFLMIFC